MKEYNCLMITKQLLENFINYSIFYSFYRVKVKHKEKIQDLVALKIYVTCANKIIKAYKSNVLFLASCCKP